MHVPSHHHQMWELSHVTVRVRRKTVELSPVLLLLLPDNCHHNILTVLISPDTMLLGCHCSPGQQCELSLATCCGIRWQSQCPLPVAVSSVSGKAILMQFSPRSLLSPLVTSGDLFVFTKYFPPHFSLFPTLLFLEQNIVIICLEFGPQVITSYLATLSLKWHLINIFLQPVQPYQSWWMLRVKKNCELGAVTNIKMLQQPYLVSPSIVGRLKYLKKIWLFNKYWSLNNGNTHYSGRIRDNQDLISEWLEIINIKPHL